MTNLGASPLLPRIGLGLLLAVGLDCGRAHAVQDPLFAVRLHRAQLLEAKAVCVERQPDMALQLDGEVAQWQQDNASLLDESDARFGALPPDRQELAAEIIASVRKSTRSHLESVSPQDLHEACGRLRETVDAPTEQGYLDARTYGEAVTMFGMTITEVETLAGRCTAQFPAQSAAIDRARQAARARDAALMQRAGAEIGDSAANSRQVASDAVNSGFDTMLKNGQAEMLCRNYFADLEAGEMRKQTPKVYEFLENGPTAD